MSPKDYRVSFIFDIAEVYRYLFSIVQLTIDEKEWSHRVTAHDIIVAWFQEYLEKAMALGVHPTEQSWAKAFFTAELMNNTTASQFCYRLFAEALHPSTHPCFHQCAHLTITPQDLKVDYIVPYKDIA